MLGVVHKASLRKRANHNRGDSRTIPPNPVRDRRSNMVPAATMLIVGNDDEGVLPILTILDSFDDVGDVLLTL
jgi:hypothetical protein